MKIHDGFKHKLPGTNLARTPLFTLAVMLGLAATPAAFAANGVDTWNSAGTTANWGGTGAGGNWTGVNAPPITGDGLVFDADNSVGSGLGDVLTDNLTVGGTNAWTFTNITFTLNAPAYTFVTGIAAGAGPGAGFTLGTTTASTVINQNSGSAQTINDVINLAAAQQTISLGSGNLNLYGAISGTGGITLDTGGNGFILTLTNGSATGGENYTGPTIVHSGAQLNLGPFPNTPTNGIYKSQSLTIQSGATVQVMFNNSLAGSGGTLGNLPVTNSGTLTFPPGSTTDSAHIRGLLTLNGGTLADGGTANQGAFGTWDIDDGVVVIGTSGSIISANDVIPDQAGGTIFNVAVTGGSPDLDVQGTLIRGTSQADTGIIKQGLGTMQLEALNTYTGATTISAGTLTINSGALLGGAAGAYAGLITNNGTLNYNGSGSQTFSGIISGSGALNVNAGTLKLPAANTYSGATAVASGANLVIVSGGSSLSAITMAGGTTLTENVATTGGQWALTNNLTFVDSSPALVLNFSNTLSTTTAPLLVHGNINFASTLTLTLNGNVLIPTGTYPLITWSGTGSGTAPTTANANVTINLAGVTATVVQSGSTINLVVSSGTQPVTWNTGSGTWNTSTPNWVGGAVYKDGDSVTFPDTSGSSPITVTLNSVVTPSGTTFTNSTKNYILSGTGGIVGSAGLTKLGSGTLTISTTNQYTGATTVTGGTLALDFTTGATNSRISGSALTLGSATLSITGTANNTITNDQAFTAVAFTPGLNIITAAAASGGNAPELDLGAMTTTTAAMVNFVGPAYNTNDNSAGGANLTPEAAASPAPAGTALITTTTAGAGAGSGPLIGGLSGGNGTSYATVGLYDWAATMPDPNNGSVNDIVGASQLAGFYVILNGANNNTPDQNYDVTGNSTVSGAGSSRITINSMRFNTASNLTVGASALTTGNGNPINLGGILVTPNVSTNNVTMAVGPGANGWDTSNTGSQGMAVWQNNVLGELIFPQNTHAGGISPNISGNGYIQAGAGTVSFTGVNNYGVGTFLNGGVLEISQSYCLGGVILGSLVGTPSLPVYLDGGTLLANYTGNFDDGTNNATGQHPIAIDVNGGGVAATAGNTFTVDGVITNKSAVAGPLIIGIPASSANGNIAGLVPGTGAGTANSTAVYATGTVVFTNLLNNYNGGTIIDSGILQLNGGNLGVYGTGGITLNGGTFQWPNGNTTDISTRTITLGSGGGTLDINAGSGTANSITLANAIGNGGNGGLTVASSTPGGKLTLSGANTYTGGTTVSANSTLVINGSLSSGKVTNNGTLGGTGPIGGNVIWNSGAAASLTAGTPLAVSGTVTLNGNSVTVIGSSLTSAGSPYTLLTTTGGFTGGSTVSPVAGGTALAAGYVGAVSISGSTLILTVSAVPSATWTGAGNWSVPGNWNASFGSPPPSGAQATAIFGTGASPVNLDVNETVGTIAFNSSTIPYTISGAHTLTLDASGSGAAITMATGAANATIATPVSLNDGLTATVNAGDTLAINNAISSTSTTKTLTANGAGTLALSGNNTYGPSSSGATGTTLSGGGTLQVGNNNALGAGDLSAAGSTIQAGAAGLALANRIVLGAGATTVDNNGNNLTLNGVISGSGSLAKISNHTLILGGANTYANGTTVNGGFVGISADGASGGSAGNLGTVPSSVVAANVTLNGGGLLATTTLSLNANRGVTLTGTGLLDAGSGVNFTVGGIIAGVGNGITVNSGSGDTGTVVLGGANTFSGTTLVSAGILQVTNSLALQSSTLNYVSGSLDFAALNSATLGGLSGSQNLNLINDAAAAVALTVGNNNATTSYTGILGGAGSLNKIGAGSLTVGSGASGGASYSGATTVGQGILTVGGAQSMNAGTNDITVSGLLGSGTLNVVDSASVVTSGNIVVGQVTGNTANLVVGGGTGGGSLTGSILTFGSAGFNGPGLASATIQNNGSLTAINHIDLDDGHSASQGGSVTVNLNGGTLTTPYIMATFGNAANVPVNINFNGGVLVAAGSDPSGSTFLPVVAGLNVNVTNVPAIINSSNNSITIAASLVSSGGDAGLVKLGSGYLTLAGANTYTGLTTVSNGTLYVSGVLNNSSENFAVNNGKAFGALYNGTTPTIGTLTLGQSSGATLAFTNVTSTSAALFHADNIFLNGSSTVKIADAVNLVAANEYPLVQIGGSIHTNSGSGFSLSLPGGVSGHLTNDTAIIPGYSTLALVVTSIVPYTPPSTISSIVVSGNNLVINAAGGTPGATVNVLSTTNLAVPLAQWTTNSTTSFDGSGDLINYTITGALSSGLPKQFYLLQQP